MIADEEVLPWIRRKLEVIGLESDTNAKVYGSMHILGSDRRGMEAYMRAFKCEHKQGVIANLTAGLILACDRLENAGLDASDFRKVLLDADTILRASAATSDTKQ